MERDASSPLTRVFKPDPTLMIYKTLEKTLVLKGEINALLDKCILFSLLISILCQIALKVCIDLINNWY